MAIDYTSKVKLQGGLSEGTLRQMDEVAKANAGVGKYENKGFEGAMDELGKYGQDKLDDAKTEQENLKVEEEKKNKDAEDKFGKISEEVQALGGSLGPNYFDSIYDDMAGLKEQYLNATTDKEKAAVMAKVNEYKLETENLKQSRKDMSESQTPPDGGPTLFSSSMTADQKHIMTEFLGNKTRIIKNEDGSRSHEITLPNGETKVMTADEISGMQILKANDFDLALSKDMQNALSVGSENGFYDQEGIRNKINNSITDDNVASLINDAMGGGKSFKQDLSEGLETSQYQDIAKMLPEDIMQKEGDEEFWYSNISKADADAISGALTDPNNEFYSSDVTKNALSNYFMGIVDNNYTKGQNYRQESGVQDAQREGNLSNIKGSFETGGNNRLANK